ncbi:hypothetical protein [Actinacidiphila sp. ITFR-21]|uniref:hypothetical protein n=1 Tax=Actinacidiphila sp. ITFR-21 TaxID=3075199 RepID=UPI00288A7BBC|nr:hypothetical protein [Streptomyces sp. ITFR-21]WNI20270.1 hypothetical protein RLT57_32915 [Streptomyces sp. ITFR-21]
MACSCGKNKKQFEVVIDGGKVVYTSSVKSTAESVAKRYANSTVREKGAAPAASTTKTAPATPAP